MKITNGPINTAADSLILILNLQKFVIFNTYNLRISNFRPLPLHFVIRNIEVILSVSLVPVSCVWQLWSSKSCFNQSKGQQSTDTHRWIQLASQSPASSDAPL